MLLNTKYYHPKDKFYWILHVIYIFYTLMIYLCDSPFIIEINILICIEFHTMSFAFCSLFMEFNNIPREQQRFIYYQPLGMRNFSENFLFYLSSHKRNKVWIKININQNKRNLLSWLISFLFTAYIIIFDLICERI